ncbi:CD1871A family CXXC motif-containing protein [Gallicola sp. Sow4_E12]|uniref:CD1871A family CXXC motif-containing protein n=1 Tax=Gallicola sp. Sow4_E12 TaxID=3438785 RepID=UPI003F917C5B
MKNLLKFSKNKIGAAVLVLGALFLGLGYSQGGVMVVFRKAAAICLECVGIG